MTYQLRFISILLLFLTTLSFAQTDLNKNGSLVWHDDFDGTGVPDPTKWESLAYNRRTNSNGPDGWWSKEDAYLDGNGNLVIRVRKIENKNNDSDAFDYSVGAIRTKNKFEQLHGIFEIRCKLPTQKGWWVAFWMMQGNVGSEANAGVDGSEVDILEGFGWTDVINQAIHWDGYGDAHKSTGKKTEIKGIRNGYHTYTLEWHADEYIFFIDGKETWRTTGGGVCNRPGYLKVTGEISTEDWAINKYWSNNPADAQYPDSLLVDYVRVYEFKEETTDKSIRELVHKCYPEGNLIVGSACHEHYLGTKTEEILDNEFSYVTPANDFKQSYVHPSPGVWNWTKSETWVDHCRRNNQLIRLHAPISPQCSKWAKEDNRTAAELEQNLNEYMTALCKRYNDTTHIKWLDVVNETVSTNGSWFGPKDGTDKWENPWPKIGYDETHELRPPIYIKKAFEIANEHAPNFKLIINQHGGMEPAAWDKIKSLVSYLREKNLRVDGIGWQAHIWMGWEKEANNMNRLSELIDWCHKNDLEFHITEFNVWLKPEDAEKLTEQANTFYEISKLAAEKQKSGFVGINYWHIRGVETQNKDRDGGPWAENYEPKESYFKIKDALCEASEFCAGDCGPDSLILDVDTFKTGSLNNLLNGKWESFSDANSTHSLNLENEGGIENSVCGKFEWTRKKGAVDFPFAVFQTYLNENDTAIDLSSYFAIKFQAKGTGLINVGLITNNSLVDGNHYYKEIDLKKNWTNFEISFNDFKQNWGEETPIDIGSVIAITFSATGNFNQPGEMWIDNIQFISENVMSPVKPPEPIEPYTSFRPKINQLGYLPQSNKQFSIIADSVSASQEFSVLDEENNEVFLGNVDATAIDDTEISGETVLKGDFSSLSSLGTFKIKVGKWESFPFQIHEKVYDSTLNDIMHFFNLVRANVTINDVQSGMAHPESHIQDATLKDSEGNILDLTGGWYNAGDFGKWVHTTAFACNHLLNLYETNPNYFKNEKITNTENKEEIPDILNLIKVGLDWLLKMQRSDGAVYHKIDSEPNFAYGYGPDEDPHTRNIGNINQLSTIDAADFSAVIAHASRVYSSFDTIFSEICKTAALKSWEWVQANPGIGQKDIYYTDPITWHEELWARAEIFKLTGDQSLLSSFYVDLKSKEVSFPSWSKPHIFGYISLFEEENIPATVKSWIEIKIMNYARELKETVDKSGYGSALDKYAWGWGSNTFMSNIGAVFIYAHKITGDDVWVDYASQQLDYLLGRNSLDYSFVSGYGTNYCLQPFHWITKSYGISPKGFIGQGAIGASLKDNNNVDKHVKVLMEADFPSAKIYKDTIDSWNSNEVGIYTMSSLAFLTGYLALHKRNVEITNTQINYYSANKLDILVKNKTLYCTNCNGNVKVLISNLNGQILLNKSLKSNSKITQLVDYSNYLINNPILFYRVMDETGSIKSGKLTFGN